MSFRRDVQKLTNSTKWARIQGKFQEKHCRNETMTLCDALQKSSVKHSKDHLDIASYKNNENATVEDSKKLVKENAAINDNYSLYPPSKQIDADVKVHANSLEELQEKNSTQYVHNNIDANDNLLDSEVTGNKHTFVTKTFSEITNESLRSLFRNKPSANKIKSESAVSQDGKDKKDDTHNIIYDTKLVENWLINNYNANENLGLSSRVLSVQNDHNIKETQQIFQSCHKEIMTELECSHIISHPDKILENGALNYVSSEEFLQKKSSVTRRNTTPITPLNISKTETRKTLRHSCLPRTSFRDRRKHQKSQIKVKNLIHKFEKISVPENQDNNFCGASNEEQYNASFDIQPSNECCSNCRKEKTHYAKVTKNRDDSGISEGEEATSSKYINQTINHRLIESYNRHIDKINAENNACEDSLINIYSNLYTGRMCREMKRLRSRSPRQNFIIKKPMPLPRSRLSQHYSHISDCYSGYCYQQRDLAKKKNENAGPKLSQSEEEWADISEEEKEVISYSQKLAKVSKRFYDLKIPVYCSESVNLYDCCSPTRERWNSKANGAKDDNSTGDSSWETMSLHQQEEEDDGDKSSTASSEHHYEAINDFKFDPGDFSTYRSDQQSPDDFIRESFKFLYTHSADESDDIESPSALSVESNPLQNNYRYKEKRLSPTDKLSPSYESKDSITESILMYQELSSFRKSFKKKTIKSILKENALESLFSKNSKEKLNFRTSWFLKTDLDLKLPSYESIPEQLGNCSPELKEKKKSKYFTMPHPKTMSRSEQHLDNLNSLTNADVPVNFNPNRRASDSSPFSPGSKDQENHVNSSCQEPSGNEDSMQSQLSSATNTSEGNRDSVASCTTCGDGYICKNHLESIQNSSSSAESINCSQIRKPIQVNANKIRKRSESTGSEHSYFQITEILKPLIYDEATSYEQVMVNNQNNDFNNSEEQNDSELYCELNSGEMHELPSEARMSIEELSYLSQNGEKKLWSDLPEVQKSGVLERMSAQELKLQEAIFNVAIFEATYLRLLETYQEHFVRSSSNSGGHSLCRIISWHEWHLVFSDSLPIIDISKRLIADIEHRWDEDYMSFDITDILYDNIMANFHAYVKYCSNKPYRDRMLKVLMNTKPKFAEVTRHLEASSVCQGFLLHEFLMLPAHHISDLLILIEEIFHWLPSNSSKCNIYNEIMEFLRKLKLECEKGALQMERMEEMLLLAQQIVFKECKPLSLISVSRWLEKRGEMTHLIYDFSNKRAFVKSVRWSKMLVYIFLFNDYVIVSKRRSEENYSVLDYCPRNMVQAKFIEDVKKTNLRPPSNYKNILHVILWSNHENKTVEMFLNCPSESDKIRWGEALIPDKATDSDINERQDNPHVQCIQPYTAQQADELTLFELDVVKVLKKISDGWCKGKHVKDGNVGWFPAACVTEINIHDFKVNYLSLGKYSQASVASGSKIPVSPK